MPAVKPLYIKPAPKEKTQVGLIYGKTPDSDDEWRVAVGLWKLGWEFKYQVWFLGGRILPGGTVIDFLVFTVPLPTPLYVDGTYWHGGPKAEEDKITRDTLAVAMGGQLQPPKAISGDNTKTQEDVDNKLYQLFGHGPRSSIAFTLGV